MKIFKTPFATQGDRVAVPDEMQSDGSVSYTQGYSQDYEKEYDKAGAKDIERSKMNAIFHDITDAIGKGQSTGIYPWIKEAAPYAKGSFVYYNKEAFYSLVDNNSDTPADGSKWRALSKKQDALTFTGSGDVVRKSVTDALDKRVTTAQSSADSALKEAQSKQDKLEFVGSGKVMKEGAGGWMGSSFLQYTNDSVDSLNSELKTGTIRGDGSSQTSNVQRWGGGLQVVGGSYPNQSIYRIQMTEQGVECLFHSQLHSKIHKLYSDITTRTDKNGVIHATTSTPINTLNVSDMSQSVVNRDDITVTSGAVFRADNELKRELIDSTPVGIIHAYVSENPPNDTWLLCRGQTFSGSKYPLLAKIFPDLRVPDLRGVALRGLDAGKNHDPNRKLLSYQEDAMQLITGRTSDIYGGPNAGGSGALQWRGEYTGNISVSTSPPTNRSVWGLGFDSSKVARTNTQNETVMKNVAVNFIIKAK